MSISPKLALLEEYALVARALSAPARLMLLEQLAQGERGVEALAAGLPENPRVKVETVYCLGLCSVGPNASAAENASADSLVRPAKRWMLPIR